LRKEDLGNPLYNKELQPINKAREKLSRRCSKPPRAKKLRKKEGAAEDDGQSVFSMATSSMTGT
jgi:hypothetical protein